MKPSFVDSSYDNFILSNFACKCLASLHYKQNIKKLQHTTCVHNSDKNEKQARSRILARK